MHIFSFLLLCVVFGIELHADPCRPPPSLCYFVPPKGWQPVRPPSEASLVRIGFIQPQASGFSPSLNLAEEPVKCSLKEYLDAVKNIHQADHKKEWRYLGTLLTPAGEAALTQMRIPSPWGDILVLQFILIRGQTAYILTGACDQRHFTQYATTFKTAFHSLRITDDLVAPLTEGKKRMDLLSHLRAAKEAAFHFADAWNSTSEWRNLEHFVTHECREMGAHWQILFLQEAGTACQQGTPPPP